MGATAGDVDGDGDLDLFVSAWGANQLFRNDGDGTFTDRTEASGLGNERWNASAAFGDADRDGDLDLYVTGYLAWSIERHRNCEDPGSGIVSYCYPASLEGEPDRFYRNRGDGSFEDLSLLSGTAFSDRSEPETGMGIAIGDLWGDGRPDIYVTNYALETNALYRNMGQGLFVDARHLAGVAEPSIPVLGFGTAFADFDLDGDLDLAVANGHVIDSIERIHPGLTYAQPNQILEQSSPGRFVLIADAGLEAVRVSRGLAVGDLDGDGDLDMIITNSNDVA